MTRYEPKPGSGIEPRARRRRLSAYVVGLATAGLAVGYAGSAFAEGAEFGMPPAAHTGEAISAPPTQPTLSQEGLYASVGFNYSHSSNVERASVQGVGPQGDSSVVITPQAGYRTFVGRRNTAEVGVSSQFTRYKELSHNNSDNYTAHALTNLDITSKLGLGVFGNFTHAAEPRGGPGTRLVQSLTPDVVNVTGYGGLFTIGQRESRIQIELGADRHEWRYQNNQQEFRNRDDDRIHGRVYYNISPRTSVFAGAGVLNVNYSEPTLNADSQELGFSLGSRWDVTSKTTGEVSIGRTKKDFDDPTLVSPTTTTYAGTLRWTPRQRTSVSLYGARRFEESSTVYGDYFISDLVGATIHESIAERWHAFVYANHTNSDYHSGRQDKLWDYGTGVSYAFRRWLSIGVQYTVLDRTSNAAGAGYTDRVVGLYLRGGWSLDKR